MPWILLSNVTVYGEAPLALGSKGFWERIFPRKDREDGLPQKPAENAPKLIDDITLSVRAKETIAVVGPSGSGKTTLIKAIAGLVEPHEGVITYDDEDVQGRKPGLRRIGMIFQEQALYDNMTSQENIGFYYKLRKEPEKIPQRIRDISTWMKVDLEPLLARRPPTLSGGEKQRVAIARALARDFDIFLFDEPLSHLDPALRRQIQTALKQIFTRYPVTTLYVTHDLNEAVNLGDRLLVMKDGHIEQLGTHAELYERPETAFVANFVGDASLLEGRIRDDGKWRLGEILLDAPEGKVSEGNRVTAAIRPNELFIEPDGLIPVRVESITPHYDRRVQEVQAVAEKRQLMLEFPLENDIPDEFRVTPNKIHWFDTKSGKRLSTTFLRPEETI